jgi:flagellar hook-length control protein FliK
MDLPPLCPTPGAPIQSSQGTPETDSAKLLTDVEKNLDEVAKALGVSKVEVEPQTKTTSQSVTPKSEIPIEAAETLQLATKPKADIELQKQPVKAEHAATVIQAPANTKTGQRVIDEVKAEAADQKAIKPQANNERTTLDAAEPTTLLMANSKDSGQDANSGSKGKASGEPSPEVVTNSAKNGLDSKALSNEELESETGLQLGRPERASVVSQSAGVMVSNLASDKPAVLPAGQVDLVVKQVADKLQMLAAARPRNGVTIHLNPDSLGSITVVVKSIGRLVDTQLTASDPRVREALDQNQTRLIEAMDARGFQIQSVQVSQQSSNSTHSEPNKNWQASDQRQNQSQDNSGQWHGNRGQQDRPFLPPKANIRAWVRRGEGVDLSI